MKKLYDHTYGETIIKRFDKECTLYHSIQMLTQSQKDHIKVLNISTTVNVGISFEEQLQIEHDNVSMKN